jgi:hypothetical protein
VAHRHLLIGLLFTAGLIACTRDGGPSEPGDPSAPLSMSIGPDSGQVGESVDMGIIFVGDLSPNQVIQQTWTSSDTTLVRVTTDGIVTPRRIGNVDIRAAVVVSRGGVQETFHDTVSFTSFLNPYNFVFSDTISSADRQIIRDGIQYADAYQKSVLGRAVAGATTVSGVFSAPGCSQGGAAAYTGAGTVVFCLGNPGWKNNGPIRKQKIVQHELFHVWQFEYGWISNPATAGATWLIEGAAEWMGYKGVAARGLLSFETALGCQVKEAADFATRTPPGLPALSSVESRTAFQNTQGPLYTHSMLAAEHLVGTGGPMAFRAYADSIKAGAAWQASFQGAFGKSTATFYSQFPGYVSGLTVPANYLCGI